MSSIFPAGELIPYEGPDFLVHCDTGVLGLEVTALCRQDPRTEAGKLAKIPERAKARYQRMNGFTPVDVSLAFSQQAANLKIEQLTRSLTKFVCAHREIDGVCPRGDLPEGFLHIGIHCPIKEIDPTGRWYGVRSFDTTTATKLQVESRIAEKNGRLARYRFSASRVWLLIVNDQFLGPGEVCVDPCDLAEWRFVFDFEKVLLFIRQPGDRGAVFELQHI